MTDQGSAMKADEVYDDGESAAPFDPVKQFAREQAIFGAATQFYGWHYPPFFLGLAGLLAGMPYWLALIIWQGATLELYLLAYKIQSVFSWVRMWGGGLTLAYALQGAVCGAAPPLFRSRPQVC